MESNENIESEAIEKKQINHKELLSRFMALSGYVCLGVTATIIMFLAIKYSNQTVKDDFKPMVDQSLVSFVFQHYTPEILLLVGAIITGKLGLRLIFGANSNASEVIPAKDRELLEPLIKSSNKEAINQYVILSSLSGFTGTFQKIGFSGLPLATVTLTLIFSVLSFLNPEFMELAKLTLGAFIGSFVQKGQDQIKIALDANKASKIG